MVFGWLEDTLWYSGNLQKHEGKTFTWSLFRVILNYFVLFQLCVHMIKFYYLMTKQIFFLQNEPNSVAFHVRICICLENFLQCNCKLLRNVIIWLVIVRLVSTLSKEIKIYFAWMTYNAWIWMHVLISTFYSMLCNMVYKISTLCRFSARVICLIFNTYKIWVLKHIKFITFQEMSRFCIHDALCMNLTADLIRFFSKFWTKWRNK